MSPGPVSLAGQLGQLLAAVAAACHHYDDGSNRERRSPEIGHVFIDHRARGAEIAGSEMYAYPLRCDAENRGIEVLRRVRRTVSRGSPR